MTTGNDLAGSTQSTLRRLMGTSNRTYFAYPLATLLFDIIVRRRLRLGPGGLPGLLLMAAGYWVYRSAGAYLMKEGGGSGYGEFTWNLLRRVDRPPSNRAPTRLVTTGPYALIRNPMYLGHIIFMIGLTLFSRSPLALALTVFHTWWLDKRADEDESLLEGRFGAEYREYMRQVRRWLPGPIPMP